jgi:hypothetical protein
MADDRSDDERDERIAGWLQPEPLDEVTRRRLVAGAMRASEPGPATRASSSHAWRWIAAAAAIVVVLVAGLALLTAPGGNDETAFKGVGSSVQGKEAPTERASPDTASTPPVDVGDFGDLSQVANLRRLRAALENRAAAQAPAAAAGEAFDSGATSSATTLSALPCRDGLPAGTISAVASGTLEGRTAVVVLTDLGDGERSIDAVLRDPCEVRPLS